MLIPARLHNSFKFQYLVEINLVQVIIEAVYLQDHHTIITISDHQEAVVKEMVIQITMI